MIDFVGTPPFFKIALWVTMETMHFHIAQTGLFLETFVRILEVHNLAPIKIVMGVQGRSN